MFETRYRLDPGLLAWRRIGWDYWLVTHLDGSTGLVAFDEDRMEDAGPWTVGWPGGLMVPVEILSAALDEIYRLRKAMAYEAGVIAAHLDLKTFPKSRRYPAQQQIERMRSAARGEERSHSTVQARALRSALGDAGASETLTRDEWEHQRGLR